LLALRACAIGQLRIRLLGLTRLTSTRFDFGLLAFFLGTPNPIDGWVLAALPLCVLNGAQDQH
jgi:hypothetical protein